MLQTDLLVEKRESYQLNNVRISIPCEYDHQVVTFLPVPENPNISLCGCPMCIAEYNLNALNIIGSHHQLTYCHGDPVHHLHCS